MATKYKFTLNQVIEYFNKKSPSAKNKILFDAIFHMEAKADKASAFECIAYAMHFTKYGEEQYILEDYAHEEPEHPFPTYTHRDMWVNSWLHNKYGLEDGQLHDAGGVEELCKMLAYDLEKAL